MNLQNNINIKKIFVLVFAVLLVCSVSKVSAQAVPAEKDMLLVFDASGSMLDKFGGVSRIDALKSATGDLLDILDPSVMVGLRPFANVKQPTQALACKETSLVQDFTKERTIIKAQSSLLQAVGTYTPLAYTLNIAIGDYTVGNDNVLILLTDGKDTCGGDPVKAAGDLFKSTKKVKIYVIGLGVDVSTQTQLKAIASAGGGLYYNANDSTTLASSFKAIQEAERPVDKTNTDSTLGKEVIGGNGFETATDVGYGDYHLSHNLLPDQFDYFKLPVTAGKKITFTVQNADLGVLYDKVTNTFSESSKTEDSYKFEVFTPKRGKILSFYNAGNSEVTSETHTPSETGYIYVRIGGYYSQPSFVCYFKRPFCEGNLSKKTIFTIQAEGETPAVVPVINNVQDSNIPSKTAVDSKPAATVSKVSATSSVDDALQGVVNAGSKILLYVLLGVLAFIIVLIVVIVLIVRVITKKKGPQTSMPVQNNYQPQRPMQNPTYTPPMPNQNTYQVPTQPIQTPQQPPSYQQPRVQQPPISMIPPTPPTPPKPPVV